MRRWHSKKQQGDNVVSKVVQIKVPSDLGSIIDRYQDQGESPLLVYLIKAVVGDELGQKRVAGLIEYLHKTHNVTDVFIDTVSGKPGISATPGFWGRLGNRNVPVGTPEFVQMSGQLPLNFLGVEDKDLHEKQQQLFRSLHKRVAKSEPVFQQIDKCLESLQHKHYPAALQNFETKIAAFNDPTQNGIGFEEIIHVIDENVRAGNIQWDHYPKMRAVANARDLPRPDQEFMNQQLRQLMATMLQQFVTNEFAQQHMVADPDLWHLGATHMLMADGHANTLEEAIELEKSLTVQTRIQMYMKFKEKVSLVLGSMIGAMSKPGRVLDTETQGIIQEAEVFSGLNLRQVSNADVFQILVDLSSLARIDLEADYPEFLKGAHQMAHSRVLSVSRELIVEVNQLQADMRRNLAETDACKMVIQMHRHIEGMRLLVSLNAIPDEAYYTGTDYEIPRGQLTLARFLQFNLINECMTSRVRRQVEKAQPEVDDLICEANHFYLLAEERGEVIVRKGLSELGGADHTDAIFVVTGYLEPYIVAELKANGISYVSINPKVDDAAAATLAYRASLESGLGELAVFQDFGVINQMAAAIQAQDWAKAIKIGEERCLESKPSYSNFESVTASHRLPDFGSLVETEISPPLPDFGSLAETEISPPLPDFGSLTETEISPPLPGFGSLAEFSPLLPDFGSLTEISPPRQKFVRRTYSIPQLKLRDANPILYYYLAIAHFRKENFTRAAAFASAARKACDEKDAELKGQIMELRSQLTKIIETLKSNEDGRFMQFLEPVLEADDWPYILELLEDFCFDEILSRDRSLLSNDEPTVTLPKIKRSIHPMILLYLAVAYVRNQYPKTALEMANIALSHCHSEHEEVKSQLENLITQLKGGNHPKTLSEVAKLLNEGDQNVGTAWGIVDDILNKDERNGIAYFYRAICMQRMISMALEKFAGNIDAGTIYFIRDMCSKLNEDIKNARYYGSTQDQALRQQLDMLDQFHQNVCSRF
jgi:hypothetical protein